VLVVVIGKSIDYYDDFFIMIFTKRNNSDHVFIIFIAKGDSPTGDFHLMRTCPCRAYTITAADCESVRLNFSFGVKRKLSRFRKV